MPSFVRFGAALTANSLTASSQIRSSITALADGGFVVVWQSLDPNADGSGYAVRAQRYDAQGVAVGAETLINNAVAGDQTWPRVASLASGGYVVTWDTGDTTQDGSGTAIKARLFDASGAAVGDEFRVNTQGLMDQKQANVVGLADGGFVIAWQTSDPAQDGAGGAIKAQRFDAAGVPVGAEFRINTTAFGTQINVDLAALANGGFVATWQTGNSSGTQISAQVYGADGARIGSEFLVSNGFGTHLSGRVAALPGGGFIVTWVTDNGNGLGPRAQIFDAAGNKVGADFIVAMGGSDPDVAVLADGSFLITWWNDSGSLKSQAYDAAGQRQGPVTSVYDGGSGGLAAIPSVAALANGSIVVGWDHLTLGTGGSHDIKLQMLRPNTAPELGAATQAISVAENGQFVTTLTAADADGPSAVGYTIVGGADAARFTIGATTGQLRFAASPNYEAPADSNGDNVYEVVVRASDGDLADLKTLSVTVSNVNEGVTITSNGAGATAAITVLENQLAATNVVAVDGDGGPVTYSISGGADAARFLIDAATGALGFLMVPDHEQPGDADANNVYQVTVRATDGVFADTQALSITVGNVNERPVIVSNGGATSASLSVDEGQTAVTTVAATDADGPNPVTYSITGGPHADLFVIDAATGALSFAEAPDYEAPGESGNFYSVTVTASDGELTSWQSVQISVGNVNEGVAITSGDAASIAENGTEVIIVTAEDMDGDAVTFAIAGGADAALFAVDDATGALSFLAAPNFEAPGDAGGDNVYDVVVSASDGALSDSRSISVIVGDEQEAVAFVSNGGGDAAAVTIDERTGHVTTLLAMDPDGMTPSYGIAGGADAALFAYESFSRTLRFIELPDFENARDANGDNVYEVIVGTFDGHSFDYQTLSVTVANVYEGVDFGGPAGAFSLDENETAVGTVSASADANAPLYYAIAGGDDAARFTIDSGTGVLAFVAAPDFDSPEDAGWDNVYNVRVSASDGIATASQYLSVTVGNVDEPVEILSYGGAAAVALTVVEHSLSVGDLEARDEEDWPVTFSITGGADAARFEVDPYTGALAFIYPLMPDFEAPADAGGDNVYDVVVTASSSTSSADQAFAITVTNRNEGPWIISDGSGDADLSVNEGDRNVTTVVGYDPDGTTPTYSILGGPDADLFTIDAVTGALTFIDAPDYEAPHNGTNLYTVEVGASDGEHTGRQKIRVEVNNVNEGVTITSGGGAAAIAVSVGENGTAVASITASDVDGDALTYSISGGADASQFAIDAQTGVLRFVQAANFEAPSDAGGDNVYDVVVSVTDGAFADSQALSVTVGNVNEGFGPGWANGGRVAAENQTFVGLFTATDLDGDAATYAITDGDDAHLFTIDAATGALSFIAAPDYETPASAQGSNSYRVFITASDGSLSEERAFNIIVANQNEGVTITSGGGGATASVAALENGVSVTAVTAVDGDGTAPIYAIVGGADAARFAINSNGLLYFRAAPDFEAPGDANGDNVYDVIVSAGDGSFTDTQAIAVAVGNVNEGVTITSHGGANSVALSVAENGSAVTGVAALDADGGPVSYAIVGGQDASRFTIDAQTGALTFVSAPNVEAPADAGADNVYDVVVAASDGALSDSQAFAVSVVNLNEAVTIISNGGGAGAAVAVAENGREVTTVTGSDADGGAVTYAIVGGADAARFTIDAATGVLSFLATPNFETPTDAGGNNVYDVVVSASDGSLADTQALAVSVTNVREGNLIFGTSGGNTISTTTSVSGQPRATELEDTIYGMGGNDTISGAGGADIIDGGSGNDTITGGLGADELTGGVGADKFVYNSAAESGAGASDVIKDFSRSQGDKINLNAIDANVNVGGNQNFQFIGTAAFSHVAGQLRFEQVNGSTFVSGDVNGDGVADFLIQLEGLVPLISSDFVL
jgi:hypothetical protein